MSTSIRSLFLLCVVGTLPFVGTVGGQTVGGGSSPPPGTLSCSQTHDHPDGSYCSFTVVFGPLIWIEETCLRSITFTVQCFDANGTSTCLKTSTLRVSCDDTRTNQVLLCGHYVSTQTVDPDGPGPQQPPPIAEVDSWDDMVIVVSHP